MGRLCLVLAGLLVFTVPGWAQVTEAQYWAEIQRVERLQIAAIKAEGADGLRRRKALHERLVTLYTAYLDLDDPRVQETRFRSGVERRLQLHSEAAEYLEGEVRRQEDYAARGVAPPLQGCAEVADYKRNDLAAQEAALGRVTDAEHRAWLRDQVKTGNEIVGLMMQACVIEMPQRYPQAWALLKRRDAMIEFETHSAQPPVERLQRILAASGAFPNAANPRGLDRPESPGNPDTPQANPILTPEELRRQGFPPRPDGLDEEPLPPHDDLEAHVQAGIFPPDGDPPDPPLARSSALWRFLVLLGGWWAAFTVARTAWCLPGRVFGWSDVGSFHRWSRLWLPWRAVYSFLLRGVRWWRRVRFGEGANRNWAGILQTLTLMFRGGDSILVGRFSLFGLFGFQPVGLKGERHVAVIAASGSGKSVHLMTMLGALDPSASAFVVDCNGEMVSVLGESLTAQGHAVVKLDPYNLAPGIPGGSWNAIAELDRAAAQHGEGAAVPFAATLAEALIRQDSATQPVFADNARVFMKGLILYVWKHQAKRDLLRLRQLLTCGLPDKARGSEDPFNVLLFEMLECGQVNAAGETEDAIGQVIAASASTMAAGQGKEGANHFRSTAIYQTAWLDDPGVAAISKASDVHGEDLKLTNACVFMVAPLSDLQTKLSPWVRAFTMMTMYAFQRLPNIWRGIPCLMVLDEMPSLGRIEMVATSAPGFRKYGVRLVTVTQSLQRLRLAYPNEWRDFLGNAECTIWMGLDDPETLKFLSEEMLGQCRVRERVEGSPWWKPGKQVPARYQRGDKLLMDNRQCAEFLDPSSKNIIVTRFGRAPLKLKRTAYYSDLPVWKYKPFARYGDRPGRKIFRALLSRYSGSGVRSGVNPGLDRSIKAARLDS